MHCISLFSYSKRVKLAIFDSFLADMTFLFDIAEFLCIIEKYNFLAEEVNQMSTVRVGENESLDNAIRRFKRKCARDGIIGDLRKKEAYEKPSVKRKKKAEAARKRMYKS